MEQMKFKGTGVALVTPFDKDGEVDTKSLKKLVKHVSEGGVDFLVVLGTTSEAATLNAQEKDLVIKTIIDANERALPIVLGMGGNNTAAVVEELKTGNFEGIDGFLSVAPYYNKPNQEGIIAHFSEIAKASPLPIILYNVPGRTSSNISAESCLFLAHEFENIVAVKEASANFDQIMQIIQYKPDNFAVLSGDDALTLPLMSIGMDGVISVTANAVPETMSGMVNDTLLGKYADAQNKHYQMLDLSNALFAEGNPAGVKSALKAKNIIDVECLRLPLVPVSEPLRKEIASLV